MVSIKRQRKENERERGKRRTNTLEKLKEYMNHSEAREIATLFVSYLHFLSMFVFNFFSIDDENEEKKI